MFCTGDETAIFEKSSESGKERRSGADFMPMDWMLKSTRSMTLRSFRGSRTLDMQGGILIISRRCFVLDHGFVVANEASQPVRTPWAAHCFAIGHNLFRAIDWIYSGWDKIIMLKAYSFYIVNKCYLARTIGCHFRRISSWLGTWSFVTYQRKSDLLRAVSYQ